MGNAGQRQTAGRRAVSSAAWLGLCAVAAASLTTFAVAAGPATSGDDGQALLAAWLDRYERGAYASVLGELILVRDQVTIARDLERHGPSWTEAAGADRVRVRRLIAATFALELASLRLWPQDVDPLVEWGCKLVRRNGRPDATERLWQLASVAIFGRARDDGRVVTRPAPGVPVGSRLPAGPRPVDHIAHARERFPDEPRFRLAAAMLVAATADTEPARDADWVSSSVLPRDSPEARRRARARQAIDLFGALTDEPSIQAEADLRLGYLRFTLSEPDAALAHFARAEPARDPFVAYLSRFLAGRVLDRGGEREKAEAKYRAALVVIPHAQSATHALAASLFLAGRPDEAYALTQAASAARPRPEDPWHHFGYGDLRLIPGLMVDLREALR